MKNLHITIVVFLLALPMFLAAQVNLNPDSVFHGSSSAEWYANGTNIIGIDGTIYVITYKQNYPDTRAYTTYVYTIDHSGRLNTYKMGSNNYNDLYYGFPLEGTYTEGIQGNSIAFEYNGQLWHYINQLEDGTLIDPATDSYDCFAHIPNPHSNNPRTYYEKISGKPTIIKKGAFQYDSTLYFLGVYVKSSDPNYGKWCLQKYIYNKSQDRFSFSTNTVISNIPGNMYGGSVVHIDSTGQEILVINTYDAETSNSHMGFLTPFKSGNTTTFTYATYPLASAFNDCSATALIGGSCKGCRTPSMVIGPWLSERLTLFGITSSNTIRYVEYEYYAGTLYTAESGSICLPSSWPAHTVSSKYNILTATELIPKKFTSYFGNNYDGFVQENWVYYPDKNGLICGLRFTSDSWRPVPDAIVSSYDLASDSVYGPEIRSLWTLFGIVDGAPPCSVDWPVWSDPNHHTAEVKPTTLTFVKTTSSTTKVTTTNEDQYTIGEEMKTEGKKMNFGGGFKFSDTFKSTVSNSTTYKTELSKEIELNEEAQETGYFIYSVPSLSRYTYRLYPWWDTELQFHVPRSTQFRFVVVGTALILRPRDLNEYPFLINDPNELTLSDWKFNARTHHKEAINMSGLQPVSTTSWSTPQHGDKGTFESASDSTSKYTHATSYSVDASFTGKKPKVFESTTTASHEVGYETTTSSETEIGNKLEISLYNLTEKNLGVNFGQYSVATYWFRPEDYNWWFYDSLATERPWYIAHLVNYTQGKLLLISPSGGVTGTNGMVFSWKPVDFDAEEYTLFLSRSLQVTPTSVILKLDAGANTEFHLAELPAGADTGCYWSVRARDSRGEVIWSESRKIISGGTVGNDTQKVLAASPYPNPGTSAGMHILVDSKETGNLKIRIIGMNGMILFETTAVLLKTGSQTIDLPVIRLQPGVYLLETSLNQEKVIKRMVII